MPRCLYGNAVPFLNHKASGYGAESSIISYEDIMKRMPKEKSQKNYDPSVMKGMRERILAKIKLWIP